MERVGFVFKWLKKLPNNAQDARPGGSGGALVKHFYTILLSSKQQERSEKIKGEQMERIRR